MPGLVPVEAVLLLLLLFVAGGASARSLAQPSEAFDPSGTVWGSAAGLAGCMHA